jgi:hypothetical protein
MTKLLTMCLSVSAIANIGTMAAVLYLVQSTPHVYVAGGGLTVYAPRADLFGQPAPLKVEVTNAVTVKEVATDVTVKSATRFPLEVELTAKSIDVNVVNEPLWVTTNAPPPDVLRRRLGVPPSNAPR